MSALLSLEISKQKIIDELDPTKHRCYNCNRYVDRIIQDDPVLICYSCYNTWTRYCIQRKKSECDMTDSCEACYSEWLQLSDIEQRGVNW